MILSQRGHWSRQCFQFEGDASQYPLLRAETLFTEQLGTLVLPDFGTYALSEAYGVYLPSWCPLVHTWGMSCGLDILWLDRGMHIVALQRSLTPWRVSRWVPHAIGGAIEFPAGWLETYEATRTSGRIQEGQKIVLHP